MNEALLLMDEPNSARWNNNPPGHPIANCGLHGEDSSVSCPGVCAIYSNGDPNATYDGDTTHAGVAACVSSSTYGCGRPNVFQGRQASGGPANTVQFLGIPYDPPAGGNVRTMRFTNIRVDATRYGVANPFTTVPVFATISISNNPVVSFSNPNVQVGQVQIGMSSANTPGSFLQCVSTAVSTGDATNPFYSAGMKVRVLENFPTAFKVRNLTQILQNGTLAGTNYLWNGGTTWNIGDLNQNVPGAVYGTETGFMNNGVQPSANPPPGFGTPVTGAYGSPFANGGTDTGISKTGFATQGSRVAVAIDPPPAGAQVFVPIVVTLRNQANNALTGVMVLTDTNSNGGGVFSRSASANLPPPVSPAANDPWAPLTASNAAVYEVLFSDPNSLEYADIIPSLVYVNGLGLPALSTENASVNFAPLYDGGADQPSSTQPEPRFGLTFTQTPLYSINSCATTTTAAAATTTFSPGTHNVTLAATVTNTGGTVNGGTVAFTVPGIGGPVTSAAVNGGNASVSFPIPGGTHAGPYTIQAVYSGAAPFGGSSEVFSANPTTTLIVVGASGRYCLPSNRK